MRRLGISGYRFQILIVLCIMIVIMMSGCVREDVKKPTLNGEGPLAIKIEEGIPAPEYHAPADWWRRNHMVSLTKREHDKKDCMGCHNPERSCNSCHKYVGVRLVEG
ncbi:MAG: hypothetical protein HY999_04240 [Nitrospinae bacterium]|nr:hypothetical protein [Nitrospinota bacterium]